MVLTDARVLCAAGDLEALVSLLQRGGHAISEQPPYPSEGLDQPRCAVVDDLDRERPAEDLLRRVVAPLVKDGARTGLIVGTSSGNISGPWEAWHLSLIHI